LYFESTKNRSSIFVYLSNREGALRSMISAFPHAIGIQWYHKKCTIKQYMTNLQTPGKILQTQ
jgi:hypothetical protein